MKNPKKRGTSKRSPLPTSLIGPLHAIQYKELTSRAINKLWPKAGQVMGLYDPEANTIYIDKGLPAHLKEHVICHELSHAIFNQVGRFDEEGFADLMGKFLLTIMKGHPLDVLKNEETNGPAES